MRLWDRRRGLCWGSVGVVVVERGEVMYQLWRLGFGNGIERGVGWRYCTEKSGGSNRTNLEMSSCSSVRRGCM
jgi:hypothetical protein